MDLLWLVLPAILHLTWVHGYWRLRHYRKWLGVLPFVAWECFSLLYYGFPLPNSAYVKLVTGISFIKVLAQGCLYFVNSLSWDPITLFAIAALTWTGLRRWRHDRPVFMLSIGVLLQLAYTAKVGGDYMTGRFFSVPFVVSLLVLSRMEFDNPLEAIGLTAILLALGVFSPRPPVQTTDGYVSLGSAPQQVDDERGYRHNDTSLLRLNKEHSLKDAGGWVADGVKAKKEGVRVTVYRNVGYYGYFAGPGVHIIDPYAIGDPLLARLAWDPATGWASGHLMRQVPEGYPDAAIGAGAIEDPAINAYWEKLKLVTRGPLLDGARLKQIVRFNLGKDPPPPH